MIKKIPYGQSNFADMIESGYAYVDKTRYIELLENENNRYQFFIRPRRFGKSLFLSILDTETHDSFRKSFSESVQERVINFLKMYSDIFKDAEQDITHIKENSLGVNATLYWDYMVSYIQDLEQETVSSLALAATVRDMAYRNDVRFAAIIFKGKGEYEFSE